MAGAPLNLKPPSIGIARGRQPWSWRAAGCAGFRCYSVVNLSIKADDYAVNSPHLVLGSELVADLKAKTKSSTRCGSLGTGLLTPGIACLGH